MVHARARACAHTRALICSRCIYANTYYGLFTNMAYLKHTTKTYLRICPFPDTCLDSTMYLPAGPSPDPVSCLGPHPALSFGPIRSCSSPLSDSHSSSSKLARAHPIWKDLFPNKTRSQASTNYQHWESLTNWPHWDLADGGWTLHTYTHTHTHTHTHTCVCVCLCVCVCACVYMHPNHNEDWWGNYV